ncbi:D-2-hydroxyacid dehydrogenase [Yinghuangia seranimata]|uniref:D-2-hydroxyacid dehydrogenase n=1 Tax=Yinghuangia seranimata TaxID=408067 RepID=UPI00248C16AF|nr:D-2-hydroxyacid dehydrogenase [Yinghuangia seranimata]MDI2131187.1 D-2-hydroxyacid dehydrogenase [Yinghuangia seranimata]
MNPLVVGIMYPPRWDIRPAEAYRADLAALRALDPRVEIVDCRYVEDDALRTARGRPGSAADPGLRALAPELTEDQRAALARIEVALVADLPFDVADAAPRLRWVQSVAAGNGQLVSAGLPTPRVAATTAAGVNGVPIAEFAFARLLAHFKGHRELDERQREHRWKAVFGTLVSGRTLGLVGVGGIGGEIAKRAQAFGMTVYATRRRTDVPAPNVDRLFRPEDLHDMLGRCDAVVSAAPETAETVDTMDAAAFAAMRPGAFYCNVGRGSFVVEDDLIKALESGRLGAAALDVARTEPLPADDPLWDAPNLYLSAHCSSDARDHFTGVFRLFRENLARYLAGEPLRNTVDPTAGY